MPYVGGTLAPLFDQAPAKRALARMAMTGGDRMVDLTIINTPIDTGNLRTSWSQKPLVIGAKRGRLTYASGVETEVDYAPYVEMGTGLYGPRGRMYEIKPKKPGGVLAFSPRTGGFNVVGSPATGGVVFASRVMHPGSPGAHMVATAGAVLEATLDQVLAADLRRWAREQEAQAKIGMRKGITA